MSFWNIYKGKKVLITGDSGFKGSWLAIWLINLGAEVYGYSLAPYTDQDNFVKTNLDQRIKHIDADIRDRLKLIQYFKDVKPDIAFHLAAQPLVLLSYKEPVETFDINLMGVVNFFEAVRNTPSVKVAINVTSDKCYNNHEWVWGYRENDAMGGKDPYSASKGCAELITSSYIHSYFSNEGSCLVASGRAGNVIGGGDWAVDRIVPDYFRAYKKNEKLLIRNPYATRPWQHVLEPLSGYLNLAAKLFLEGRAYSGGWNFGPEDTGNYTVRELIDCILTFDSKGGYTIPDNVNKPHEATFLKLDISKAVNNLKWRPALTFKETVNLTVKGYQDDIQSQDSLFDRRTDQIKEYTLIANEKLIEWAV